MKDLAFQNFWFEIHKLCDNRILYVRPFPSSLISLQSLFFILIKQEETIEILKTLGLNIKY